MGTRNLTIAKKDGQIKFAKYCQFDGYLSGLGKELVKTLNTIGVNRVREIVDRVRPLTDEDAIYMNSFDKEVKVERHGFSTTEPEWKIKFPWASRDCNGADLLNYLNDTEEILAVTFSEHFAADSLFCEWCYVIDLDTNTFEVYEGFNKEPLTEQDRFFYLEDKSEDGFHPVKLLISYPLDNLPEDISSLETNDNE